MECKCNHCGMEVNGIFCGKCNAPLESATVQKDGQTIQVAKCPNSCGMIKSPVCCGEDMTCQR